MHFHWLRYLLDCSCYFYHYEFQKDRIGSSYYLTKQTDTRDSVISMLDCWPGVKSSLLLFHILFLFLFAPITSFINAHFIWAFISLPKSFFIISVCIYVFFGKFVHFIHRWSKLLERTRRFLSIPNKYCNVCTIFENIVLCRDWCFYVPRVLLK